MNIENIITSDNLKWFLTFLFGSGGFIYFIVKIFSGKNGSEKKETKQAIKSGRGAVNSQIGDIYIEKNEK